MNSNNMNNVTEIRKQAVKTTVEVLGDALITTDGNAWTLRNIGGLSGLDASRTFQNREAAISYLTDFVNERATNQAA